MSTFDEFLNILKFQLDNLKINSFYLCNNTFDA